MCPGAPAYGKLQAGDRVLAIDDQPVNQLADVAPLVQQHQPGEPVDVTYSRDGATETTRDRRRPQSRPTGARASR